MQDFTARTFSGETIVLDGQSYTRCTFTGCQMVYAGGAIPVLVDNNFDACTWVFDGAAGRTITFLGALHRGGGSDLIEQVLQRIRTGPGVATAPAGGPN